MYEQDDIVLIKPLGETKFQTGHTQVIFHDGTVVCSCRVTFNRFDYVLRAGIIVLRAGIIGWNESKSSP